MAQNYNTITASTTLAASLTPLLDRDDAAASCFSGTAFPTSNLLLGMQCYRTDQQKLYQLTALSPATWALVMDLSSGSAFAPNASAAPWSGITGKPTTIAGYGITNAVLKTGDTLSGKLVFAAPGSGAASARLTPGATAPSAPLDGDMWVNSTGGLRTYLAGLGGTLTFSYINVAETYSAKKSFAPSAAGGAGINVGVGANPTTPSDGDLWATSNFLRYRMGGVTRNVAFWNNSEVMAVANGGTGGADDATARTNLDVNQKGIRDIQSRGNSHTLIAGDKGKLMTYTSASDGTWNIPDGLSVGHAVDIVQLGAGQLTIQMASGATEVLRSSGGKNKLLGQYSGASLTKISSTEWLLVGDLA